MAYADYSKLKVLIVDDFDNFRMAVSKMLQEYGARDVDTVSNGRQALQLCSENRYDLILCDYNLGTGKNGQQVLEELRHRRLLAPQDRKSTRLNSSHVAISYAVLCLK